MLEMTIENFMSDFGITTMATAKDEGFACIMKGEIKMFKNIIDCNPIAQFINDNDPDPKMLKKQISRLPKGVILEPGEIDNYFGQLRFLDTNTNDYLSLTVLSDTQKMEL